MKRYLTEIAYELPLIAALALLTSDRLWLNTIGLSLVPGLVRRIARQEGRRD